jgi:hypothetical protein
MKKTLIIVLFVFISLTTFNSQAQKSAVSAGGNAQGTSGTASFSIGQISYKSPAGNLVNDGVQQPYELQVLGNSTFTTIQLEMVVFPNPTSDFLNLKIADESLSKLSYKLIDINGKIIVKTTQIINNETLITMQNCPKGIYFLTVSKENKLVKTFKIIKK